MGDYDNIASTVMFFAYAGVLAIPVAIVTVIGGFVYLVASYTIVPRQ